MTSETLWTLVAFGAVIALFGWCWLSLDQPDWW